MTKSHRFSHALAKSPMLWGGLACCGFYGLIFSKVLEGEFVTRYFASHPVEYAATAMFFVGMAALVIKVVEIAAQYRGLAQPLLGPIPSGGHPIGECEPLLARVRRLPERRQTGYLVRRLREALEHVRRSGSAETIDDELKYLADLDAARLHAGYGLVRLFVWAIPILGFLGTVIGIAQAMGNLSPQALETSMPEVMAGLTVAFDTTKLALGLSIVLMFAQFLTDRAENGLLARVDQRVEEELVGRFERLPNGPDGQLLAVRQMLQTLIGSTDDLVRRQTDLWQAAMDDARARWTTAADTAGRQLQSALTGALSESLQTHARQLAATHDAANEKNWENWKTLQHALVENTETVARVQEAVIQKAEVLGRAVEATDQVSKLEEALNHNLGALAGSRNFEQTVMSLAATIHLLNARLQELSAADSSVRLDLDPDSQTGQAA
ncbi:MAG: MotA/TolQ/ExbB proton channel family protein [Planctomycetes bacterium]|nr:MotA/TolQ/ExbB proton channel family protein [Planctomycetota bacterium]